MMQFVVNSGIHDYDVYIGRPSEWGNPYSHLPMYKSQAKFRVATRGEAVVAYEQWIQSQPALVAKAKAELRGKVLGCPCGGFPCHGAVLARIANE